MVDQNTLKTQIRSFLDNQENIGSNSGGSGHLSNTSLTIDSIELEESTSDNYEYVANIIYSTYVETEFTYFPDNPPHEYKYKQKLYFDDEFNIIGFDKKQIISSTFDFDVSNSKK